MDETVAIAQTGMDLIDKYAEKIASVVQQYGPQAIDFTLEVGRIAAAQQLIGPVFVAIVTAILTFLGFRLIFKSMGNVTYTKEDLEKAALLIRETLSTHQGTTYLGRYDFENILDRKFKTLTHVDRDFYQMVGSLCLFVSAIGLIYTVFKLMNLYAWVGLFHPEIYLAAKALNL